MINLVSHARRELALIGENQDVIEWYVRVIKEFGSVGHSGGSAMAAVPVLHELLQSRNLKPLTDHPYEWRDHSEESGSPLWLNKRNPQAFSLDGGKTYSLLDECEAADSTETMPIYASEKAENVYPGHVAPDYDAEEPLEDGDFDLFIGDPEGGPGGGDENSPAEFGLPSRVAGLRRFGAVIRFGLTPGSVAALNADQAEFIGRKLLAASAAARNEGS